jgi:hypothetical protein
MNIVEFLRQYRIGGFSIFDFVVAYGGFLLLSPIIVKFFQKIVAHVIFGNHTPLTKMFLNPHDYYFVKIIIVFMIYMGLRKVVW